MVSVSDCRSSSPGSSLAEHCVVFMGKTLYSHSAPLVSFVRNQSRGYRRCCPITVFGCYLGLAGLDFIQNKMVSDLSITVMTLSVMFCAR